MTRRVMKYAVQHRAIAANPCDAVDFSATRATGDKSGFEHRPLTAEKLAGCPLSPVKCPVCARTRRTH
jgi:integrase